MQQQSDQLDALRGNLSDDQAAYDLAAAFQTVRVSALEAEAAIKDHADGAADALRKEATDTIALKEKIVDYGTAVLGLPASQVTKIVAEVDDTQLDQLEKRLARIKANAVINAQIIDRGGAGYSPPGAGPTMVPSLAAAAAPARWARINGRGERCPPRRRTTRPDTCRGLRRRGRNRSRRRPCISRGWRGR